MSRGAVGLADLLTFLHDLKVEERDAAFEAAGYLRKPKAATPADKDEQGPDARPPRPPTPPPPAPADATQAVEERPVFWRVASILHNPDAQVTPPAWLSSTPPATMADLETDPALRSAAAPPPPLVRPSRFAAFLRRHIARPVAGAELDTDRICRAWAQGRSLARLPRQMRPRWPARLTVVLENTPTMRLFHDGCWPLVDQARQLLGQRAQLLMSEAGPRDVFEADSGRGAALPADGRSLLYIGDAGALAADPLREADWAHWAARAQAQGGTALRLTPAGRSHALARTAARWPTARLDPEDRLRLHPRAPVQPSGDAPTTREAEGLHHLLGCLHGNPCILPGMVRQMRLRLVAQGWPLALRHEAALFEHPALKTSGGAASIRPEQRRAVADAFRALPADLRRQAVQQQLADLTRLSPLAASEYVGAVLADLPPDDLRTRVDLERARQAAEDLHRRIAARLAQEQQASGADRLTQQESSSYLHRFSRRVGSDLSRAPLPLQTACVLARREALRRGEQPLPQGVSYADVAWALGDRAGSTQAQLALRVAKVATGPGHPDGDPSLQLEFGPTTAFAAPLLTGLPEIGRVAFTEWRDPRRAMKLGWSAARRWVAGDRERALAVLHFLREHWQYEGESGAAQRPLFPDALVDHLVNPDPWGGDIDRQLAEVEPLLPIARLPMDGRPWRLTLAADLLNALPEAWRDSQGIAAPTPPETRLIATDRPRWISSSWPVTLDIEAISVTVEPFAKPSWARSIRFDTGRWIATASDGRDLIWQPRRSFKPGSGPNALPAWTVPSAWWDRELMWTLSVFEREAIFAMPEWAARHGIDAYGPWAEFDIRGRTGPITQRLRWIPPGEFWMGSPESEAERRDDETLHRVLLTQGYWLADTACTQALWEAVLGENPSHFKGDPTHPVETVSWKEVKEKFLPALNRLVPGLEAELPSEAQWEYACRAGTQTPFWFGEQITSEQVNYAGSRPYAKGKMGEYRKKTVPVKSLPANGWGLYEMHGNVWEWCEDVLGDYSKEAVVDPIGPQDGVEGRQRLLRGGSWNSNGGSCRSAYRNAIEPDERSVIFGFRLARGLGVPPPAGQGAGGAGGQRAEPAALERSAERAAGVEAKTKKGAA